MISTPKRLRRTSAIAAGFFHSLVLVSSATDSSAPSITITSPADSATYLLGQAVNSYTWKTNKLWAGTCRQLIVKLADGTEHIANFKFK